MRIHTAAAAVLIGIFLIAPTTVWAQSAGTNAEPRPAPAPKELKNKMFEIKYKGVRALADVLRGLASGYGNTQVNPNENLNIITVRDFPENIAIMEDALKRLDIPEPAPANLEVRLDLIATSKNPTEKGALPQGLGAVINQLQSTLKFAGYHYVTTLLSRTRQNGIVELTGTTGTLFSIPVNQAQPTFYQFKAKGIGMSPNESGKQTINFSAFNFGVRAPVVMKTKADGTSDIQYVDVGINTESISMREGEMVVVGTANVGTSDEAIIVVLSVKKVE